MSAKIITIISFAFVFSGCVTNQSVPAPPRVDNNQIVHLNDPPAVEFSTSGWSYTNLTNPFLLTPDRLTNAMLGVSRMKKGESFPNNGPSVPTILNTNNIKGVISEKLKGKENLKIEAKSINGRDVIVANYSEGQKNGLELSFALKEHLIHVLLLAKEGKYFNNGKSVAYKVVDTFKAK